MAWEEIVDDKGRVYYYNSDTEETQWERPKSFGGDDSKIDKILAKNDWSRYTTDEGEVYYFNEKTEKSVWELPEDVIRDFKKEEVKETRPGQKEKEKEKEKENGESRINSLGDRTEEVWEEGGQGQGPLIKQKTLSRANDIVGLNEIIPKSEDGIAEYSDDIEHNVDNNEDHEDQEDNKEDEIAKQGFVDMLKEKEIDSSWPFSKVMSSCIEDDRYWRIHDPLMRKQLHQIYLIGKADEEYKRVEKSKQAYKKKFLEVLKEHKVEYYRRWRSVGKELTDEPICSVIPSKLKQEFFKEYVDELRAKHDAEIDDVKKQQLCKLREQIAAVGKFNSRFEEVLHGLYLESKYPTVDKIDALRIFESEMEKKDLELEDKMKQSSRLNYRVDRQARDRFRKLLEGLSEHEDVTFNAKMKWVEFLDLIREKPAFIELCGHKGSSAIDIYWDILDRENQLVRAKRDMCRQKLASHKLNIKSFEGNLDTFKAKMDEIGGIHSDDKDIGQVFELLQEEVSNKRKMETMGRSSSPGPKKARLARMGYGILQ
ncbi:hypothetical protein FOA43_004351 [Brettanomyces nanus]|uniref:WW domain-containing protein n=1 Tax=Eeniella nana TaxID=13502 RepID=A0A875RXM5_EENNA|nr:uncharacterized protein FOA43_004351 [Brettanomyces nanus]QPG76957.1 hypothetical protein FOA43_004351 [Brettanomyces nanus]